MKKTEFPNAVSVRIFFVIIVAALGGCAAPTVNLATSDPIKVDINMRLDVYQYGQTGEKKAETKPVTTASPKTRRDNRMADIQQFKNSGLVGEGHEGLLVIQESAKQQKDDYRDYIRATIEEENADRITVMKALAENEKTSLPEIQSQQAEIWRNRSFKGEWIEVPVPEKPSEWRWVQKEG
jgi:uncharacterized protein YdbL (DUF1318 family)